jgi:DNA repair protein RecO (recombination protein O)
MATHYRTQGVFIKKTARGEADEVFTIYTRDFGKLRVLAKAVRKITSKLRAGADLFYFSEIEFIQGKSQKTLTDAVLIDKFPLLGKNLSKLRLAHSLAMILDKLTPWEEKDEKVWKLLQEVLGKMNDAGFKIYDLKLVYYYFFWNLVSLLGYRPKIENCSIQGEKVDCDVIRILRVILRRDWSILSRLKLEASHLELLKNTSKWYNKYIIDYDYEK